jgi:predicted anti-sigma-YlaC factor YlaD
VHQYLMAYLERELPSREQAIIDAHLAICVDCVNYLATYQQTVSMARSVFTQIPARPIPAELVQAIVAARKTQ